MITLLAFDIAVQPGWAVGTVTVDDPVLDCDVLLDADGQAWVPGSALAGSLRTHLAAHDAQAGTTLETDLMGSRPPGHASAELTASPLWFLGTIFCPDGDGTGAGAAARMEIVGQTAIDRRRGGAVEMSLRHSRAVSSSGTLTAYARHDGDLSVGQLATLAGWRPEIGRGRSVGNGRARLTRLRHGTIDPATVDGMRTWLTNTGPRLVDVVATRAIEGPAEQRPWLEAELYVHDALLVGDPSPSGPASPRMRSGRPLVPGSAWKGVFRSRVEYIVRSLYGDDAACECVTGCGRCVTCDLFGHQGRRGRLAFHDSPVDDADTPPERTQVGIDRVAGGAHDGLLFQTRPITSGRLLLRVDALAPVPPWARTLLLHVLRDLHHGLIGVGSRTSRGMGTLRLTDPDIMRDLPPVRVPPQDDTKETQACHHPATPPTS